MKTLSIHLIGNTICFFFFSFVCISNCFAQREVEISGKITDSEGKSLSAVNVRLIIGNETLICYTDLDGNFLFRIPPHTNVSLISTHIGFETDSRIVDVSNDCKVNIKLQYQRVELAETVVVARSKALVGYSDYGVINLNSEKLEKIPGILGVPDMIKVLQLMPGVQHSGDVNGHLYVRGSDPGHNLMLYNNVPVYGTSHLTGIFPFYNTDHLDRIQFDKSGSEAKFSNRLGANIQAITPDLLPERYSLKGNVGMAASQLTVSAPFGKKAGCIISGRQTTIDPLIMPIVNSFGKNETGLDDISYSFRDANITFLVHPAKNQTIDINLFLSADKFSLADVRMLQGMMKWNNNVASLQWNIFLENDIVLHQEVYLSHYNNHLKAQQISIDLQVESEVIDCGIQSGVSFNLWNIPFEAGIRYSNYNVKPQKLTSQHLPNLGNIGHVVNAHHLTLFVQAKPQLNEFTTLNLGLNTSFYQNYASKHQTYFQPEPHISLNFTDLYRFSAYFAYSHKSQHLHLITTSSVGFPTDFWLATSEDVPIEIADNFSIGTNYRLSAIFEMATSLFYSQMKNLVIYPFNLLQFNEITSLSNDLQIGKGKAYGAEFMLKKNGRLSGWISYTLSKSDRQFEEINDGEIFPSKFDRRHNVALVSNYELSKRWNAALIQIYTTGSRFTEPTSWYFINNNPVKEYGKFNNAQMPDYVRTDISFDFYLKKNIKRESIINFTIYNLFAIKNPIYNFLNVYANETGSVITVNSRYQRLYTILPSIGWRFRF
ncbi:MAG: TonB-dependent receptor [Marinilabiliaceae bacterium]|nr:TonB-dependent receptor [Marinilabiliaceae bacterium]